MIKRVNFTGRRRIPRHRVRIEVHEGPPRTFEAAIDLSEFRFPPDAAVFLEALSAGSTVVRRFSLGTAGAIQPPEDRNLNDIPGENVFFTLKVVDRSQRFGRILGLAEHIRPQGERSDPVGRGLLPIQPAALGEQLWRLEIREFGPCLMIHQEVPGWTEMVRSDPLVQAAVFPAVLRQCLHAALAENADPDEEEERWPVQWLRFGRGMHPERASPPAPDSPEGREQWVEEVVDAFCQRHTLVRRFVQVLERGD